MTTKLEKAKNLEKIAQAVGFATWQIQELEGASAQLYVLLVEAKKGMGHEAGQELVYSAQSKTFGATVNKLIRSKCLTSEVEEQFKKLLAERNWLVHNSRASSRNAVHDNQICEDLLDRIRSIANEALTLLKICSSIAISFASDNGITNKNIEELTNQQLKKYSNNQN